MVAASEAVKVTLVFGGTAVAIGLAYLLKILVDRSIDQPA